MELDLCTGSQVIFITSREQIVSLRNGGWDAKFAQHEDDVTHPQYDANNRQ